MFGHGRLVFILGEAVGLIITGLYRNCLGLKTIDNQMLKIPIIQAN